MTDALDDRTVIVLGAGATKAFLPNAPTVEDDFGLERLLSHFRGFPYARAILEHEKWRLNNGLINIERLMSRLDGPMPYDAEDAVAQQTLLLYELKNEFIRRMSLARQGELHSDVLSRFAKACVTRKINCVTFNYDDVLDQALFEVSKKRTTEMDGPSAKIGATYWHPDGGYGFFCRPSELAVQQMSRYMDMTSMLLLKLHGSINWIPQKGERAPYNIDAIYHHQDWVPPTISPMPALDRDSIARHLQTTPLIIPPVLDKSALSKEPIFQLVWSLAKDALQAAFRVYFVGYSLPVTDLAAAYLFGESLYGRAHMIRVINLAHTKEQKEIIRSSYRKVFPTLKDNQFYFEGALQWANEVTANE